MWAEGVNVLGFPEAFIPGYSMCIWYCCPLGNAQFIHEYVNNSLIKESPEMEKVRDAVKAVGLYVVLGYSGRDGCIIFITQVCLESASFLFSGVRFILKSLRSTLRSHLSILLARLSSIAAA